MKRLPSLFKYRPEGLCPPARCEAVDSQGDCQAAATYDMGTYRRLPGVTGTYRQVRFSCDRHATRMVPYRWRKLVLDSGSNEPQKENAR